MSISAQCISAPPVLWCRLIFLIVAPPFNVSVPYNGSHFLVFSQHREGVWALCKPVGGPQKCICCANWELAVIAAPGTNILVIAFTSKPEEQWCHTFTALLISGRRIMLCAIGGEVDKGFRDRDIQYRDITRTTEKHCVMWLLLIDT